MSRRPPSRRNAEYAEHLLRRQVQSMVPGTAGGRLASASPVGGAGGGSGDAGPVVLAGDDDGGLTELHQIDTFTLSSATETLTLTYVPSEDSQNASLNGVTMKPGADYTLTGKSLTLLSALGAAVGWEVVVQYDYLADLSDVAEEPDLVRPQDNFDEGEVPDSLLTVPSDGGTPWLVGEINNTGIPIQALSGGRRKFTNVGGGVAYSLRDHGAGQQVIDVDVTFLDASGEAYIFVGASIAASKLTGYAVVTDGVTGCRVVKIVNGIETGTLATGTLAASYLHLTRHLQVVFDPWEAQISFYVEGGERFTATDSSSPLTGTLAGLGGELASAQEFDNYNLPAYYVDDFWVASPTALGGRGFFGGHTWTDMETNPGLPVDPKFTVTAAVDAAGMAICSFDYSYAKVNVAAPCTIQGDFDGDKHGLVFGIVDDTHFYYWKWVLGTGTQLVHFVNGVETVLHTYGSNARLQKAVVTSSEVTLFDNNTEVVTWSISSGGVGIYGGLPPGGNYGYCRWFGVQR